jgi:hypothetical protein
MQEDFDQEDPFKKYGGSEVKQQEDPFKKYGGSAIETPSKKKEPTDWISKTFPIGSKNGGQVGTSVPQLQENKKVVKTPQEKLKNLGIDVTFEKEDDSPKILIEATKNKFANGIPQPFPNRPTYIDLSNPESLAYLSSKIKEGKDNADPTKYGLFMSDEQKAKYRPKAAKEKIAEADELMQEVSQQASQNAFNKTISKTQPSLIDRKHLIETGLEYLKQVDPAQYKRNMTILEAGEDLGDENKYNLEKTGGAILEKNLPFVTGEEYDLNNISNLNALTDKAHPDIAIAKGWDIIGAYNHKKDNRANGGWNRTRPTVGQAKKWIEEPELLEMFKGNEVALDEIKKKLAEMPDEVNSFKIDEVPVGGLFNNLGRAILGSAENVGNIFRGDVKRQQSNLNPTLGRGTLTGNYRDPGESPALLQQLYSLEAAEKDGTITEPEKQQLKVLRSNTKVRDGWDKFADGTGNLSGQVIAQVLLTKGAGLGTGTVGKLASLSKATQTTINASIGTTLNSYDQTRQQAVYNFPDDKVKQAIYTGVMVAANVASERIFKDEKVFDAFKKELQGDIVNYVKNLSAQNINRAAIKKLVTEKLLKFGGQTLKESNKEGFEEAIVQAVDEAMQSSMGAEGYDGDKAMGRIGDTYATTMLYGAPVGALAAKSNMAADKFNRVQIYRMSKDPATFQKEIQRQYEAGEITNQERQEKLGVLGMAAQIAAAEPPKVAALPTKKKAEYLTQQLNIAINEGILDGAKDPNQQEELKANIAESQKRAKAIYESEPEVLEEIVQPKQNIIAPQTDDQWKERIAAAETEEEKDAIMREHGDWLMKQGKNDETFLKDQSLSTPNNLIERLGSEEAVIETIAKNKKEDIKGALKAWTANMQAAEPDSQEYHEAEAHVALLEAGLEKVVEAPTQEGVGKEQVSNVVEGSGGVGGEKGVNPNGGKWEKVIKNDNDGQGGNIKITRFKTTRINKNGEEVEGQDGTRAGLGGREVSWDDFKKEFKLDEEDINDLFGGKEPETVTIHETRENEASGKNAIDATFHFGKEEGTQLNDNKRFNFNYEKPVEQSLSKQESGGKAPVTKPEGKSDVVGNQQKVETKRVEKVAELEAARDMDILREGKPEVKMEFVTAKELVDSKDPIANKKTHDDIKDRYKELRNLLDCLWQKK